MVDLQNYQGGWPGRIRVLIIDDSSVACTALKGLLAMDPEIEVIATAPDAATGRDKLVRCRPDVVILDLNLPDISGLLFLERVMEHFPTPIVVVSSLSKPGSEVAARATSLGAVDVMLKPEFCPSMDLKIVSTDLCQRIKKAARVKLPHSVAKATPPNLTDGNRLQQSHGIVNRLGSRDHVLAIGASTGGTEALKEVLRKLPGDAPATLIVQHMPQGFTRVFADSLARISPLAVKEAVDGDRLKVGLALLAPGDFHMVLKRDNMGLFVSLNQEPSLHGVRPAVDILFHSVAKVAGSSATGVILTGMGRDGATGLLEMRERGAFTIVQDEESSVVFGMPKVAIEIGAATLVKPVSEIAESLIRYWTKHMQREAS